MTKLSPKNNLPKLLPNSKKNWLSNLTFSSGFIIREHFYSVTLEEFLMFVILILAFLVFLFLQKRVWLWLSLNAVGICTIYSLFSNPNYSESTNGAKPLITTFLPDPYFFGLIILSLLLIFLSTTKIIAIIQLNFNQKLSAKIDKETENLKRDVLSKPKNGILQFFKNCFAKSWWDKMVATIFILWAIAIICFSWLTWLIRDEMIIDFNTYGEYFVDFPLRSIVNMEPWSFAVLVIFNFLIWYLSVKFIQLLSFYFEIKSEPQKHPTLTNLLKKEILKKIISGGYLNDFLTNTLKNGIDFCAKFSIFLLTLLIFFIIHILIFCLNLSNDFAAYIFLGSIFSNFAEFVRYFIFGISFLSTLAILRWGIWQRIRPIIITLILFICLATNLIMFAIFIRPPDNLISKCPDFLIIENINHEDYTNYVDHSAWIIRNSQIVEVGKLILEEAYTSFSPKISQKLMTQIRQSEEKVRRVENPKNLPNASDIGRGYNSFYKKYLIAGGSVSQAEITKVQQCLIDGYDGQFFGAVE